MKLQKAEKRISIENGRHLTVSEHTVTLFHPLHWHSFFEIEIVLSGAGEYVINDVSYDIKKGCLFFLTPADYHYLNVRETTKVINVSFDETLLDEAELAELLYSNNEKAYILSEDEYKRLLSASELLQYECENGGEFQKSLLKYILRAVLRRNQSREDGVVSTIQYRGIRNAVIYMQIHFKEKLSLNKLAMEAGYHPAYFSALFFKVTGESYVSALNKLRTGYAKGLLASGFSVSDACFTSGFGSLSNFLTIFKKHSGITPIEYRRKYATERHYLNKTASQATDIT